MNKKGFANIAVIVLVIVIVGVAGYLALVKKQEPVVQPQGNSKLSFNQNLTSQSCEVWHSNIEQAFVDDNYCTADSDCQAIPLGGKLVEFGCIHYLNTNVATGTVYASLDSYVKQCAKAIDRCAFNFDTMCRANKCVADMVFYEKRQNWGPCPPGGVCHKNTFLYSSGKIIVEGKTTVEKKIDLATVNIILQKIEENNLMTRDCNATPVFDYSATYKLTLDNITREIRFPGCDKELGEIDSLLPKVDMPVDGGA